MDQMPEKTRETITKYLGDLHALESHGLQAISRQVEEMEGSDHTEAHRAVQNFKNTIESHIAAIEARMQTLGGSPTSPVKEAAAVVAGVAAGLYNKTRTEKASKSVRDDYTFISNTAVAYLMMHTTAMGLGDDQTARLAERGYRDAARMAMEIDRIIPGLVLEELRQDGAHPRSVEEECHRMIHEAWTQDSVRTMSQGATAARSTGATGAPMSGSPSSMSTPPASPTGAASPSASSAKSGTAGSPTKPTGSPASGTRN